MSDDMWPAGAGTDAAQDPRTIGAVLDTLGIGYAFLDQSWTIAHVNLAAQRITATAPGELVGRNHWDAFPAMRGSVFQDGYERAVATGETVVLQAFYPEPLNTWVEVSAVPRGRGLDTFFTDTTARVQAESGVAAANARLQLVADVNADLLSAVDVDDMVAGIAPRIVPLLADGAMVSLVDRSGLRQDVSVAHRDRRVQAALVEYVRIRPNTIPAASPLGQVLISGAPLRSSAAYVASTVVPGPVRTCLEQLGDSWSLHLPIRSRADALGVLTLFFDADRAPDAADEATATGIAGRLGTALDNAALASAQGQLAETLQRSLLTDPPRPDHGEIVVRYQPASEAARVGGDWYDAFLQPGGTTMLVIGDVAGHDTAAAATTGQVRGLLRGIAAYSDAGPAEVLRGLDASMEVLMVQGLATATVVRFEQTPDEHRSGTTRMVWASAGHPNPVVVHADGRLELPGGPQGDLLLGVDHSAVRVEHTVVLDRGATVLLYTDGLVERRDSDLDAGTARLAALVDRLTGAGGTLEDLVDGVLHGMVDGRPDDDVALVAVRLHRQDRPRPAEAGTQRIPPSVPDEPPSSGPAAAPAD